MRKLVILALSVAWMGCGPPSETPAESSDMAMTGEAEHVAVPLTPTQEEGQEIYETMCWTCHGPAGRGDGPAVEAGAVEVPPPTFHTQDYARSSTSSLERRFRVGMERADLSHPHMKYVASLLKPERFAAALSYIPALSYPPEIPGSTIAGGDIYEFRCAGCHGVTGRGDGEASESLVTVKPADFTADSLIAAEDWDGVFQRIREGGQSVHGSSMPPWGIVLDEGEMWDLVAYLATFQEGKLSEPTWVN